MIRMAHKDKSLRLIATYVDQKMVDMVDEEARKLKLSRSALIALALEMYLDAPLMLMHVVRSDDPEPPAGARH